MRRLTESHPRLNRNRNQHGWRLKPLFLDTSVTVAAPPKPIAMRVGPFFRASNPAKEAGRSLFLYAPGFTGCYFRVVIRILANFGVCQTISLIFLLAAGSNPSFDARPQCRRLLNLARCAYYLLGAICICCIPIPTRRLRLRARTMSRALYRRWIACTLRTSGSRDPLAFRLCSSSTTRRGIAVCSLVVPMPYQTPYL